MEEKKKKNVKAFFGVFFFYTLIMKTFSSYLCHFVFIGVGESLPAKAGVDCFQNGKEMGRHGTGGDFTLRV